MVRPIPLARATEGPAPRVSLHQDGAVIKSTPSPSNRVLTTSVEQLERTNDELETQLLIEMHYQTHLARQGLQELFESGELGLF